MKPDDPDELTRPQPSETASDWYARLFRVVAADISKLGTDEAIDNLSKLVDLAEALAQPEEIELAIDRGNNLLARELSQSQSAITNHLLGHAWRIKRRFQLKSQKRRWTDEEDAKQIVHYRRAAQAGSVAPGFDPQRLCDIYTSLGNIMDDYGRTVEALAYWNRAIAINPDSAMAIGNRGLGLRQWAGATIHRTYQLELIREAIASLQRALNPIYAAQLTLRARAMFAGPLQEMLPYAVGAVPTDRFGTDLLTNAGEAEYAYREWCLKEVLFLNCLNDIGHEHPWAAKDVLLLPPLLPRESVSPQRLLTFFNPLKQEYVTARFCFYEGSSAVSAHYADRGVVLVKTDDDLYYGLATEKIKVAFRLLYSVLDKIAYFLNDYLVLEIPDRKIFLRHLWYEKQDPSRPLRPDVLKIHTKAVMGLFWITKDLDDSNAEFAEVLEPAAKEVAKIRNHLEHKYLMVLRKHMTTTREAGVSDAYEAGRAYVLERGEFIERTFSLLRLVRAAIFQLTFVVTTEEVGRTLNNPVLSDAYGLQMDLPTYEDTAKL